MAIADVDLSEEELAALCLAVAWVLEDDHPARAAALVRDVLERVEERLLSAWAVLEVVREAADRPELTAG
jgi:hypothetical protein